MTAALQKAKSEAASVSDTVERTGWLAHALKAYKQLNNTNGSLLAGALTFFSFLALFPIILLVVSVVGFVLKNDQSLQNQLFDKISTSVPGSFGTELKKIVDNAIKARTGIGIVGLVGFLFTGLGWINNLRQATDQVWGFTPAKRSFVAAKLADFVVLIGLGLALLFSLVLTAGGTAFAGILLREIHLDDVPGASAVTAVLGIVVAVLADVVIFAFLLVRLPRRDVSRRLLIKGSLLASVGFEILKVIGTYYIKHVGSSPTYGGFGSIIGILVWLNLVFRFMLYCAAWTATATDISPLTPPPAVESGPARPDFLPRAPAGPRGFGPLIALVMVGFGTLKRLVRRR